MRKRLPCISAPSDPRPVRLTDLVVSDEAWVITYPGARNKRTHARMW